MSIKNGLLGFVCAAVLCWGVVIAATPAEAAAKKAEVTQAAAAGETEVYSAEGAKTCMKCHDEDDVTGIFKTPHAVSGDIRTPFAAHECESCHGPNDLHTKTSGKNKARPPVVFKGPNISPVEVRNKTCLTCHDNGVRMNWGGSQHQSNDVACNSCHTIHVAKDPVLNKQTQFEKCFTCHKDQRAQSFQFSHHPVREGKVACADCHDIHGSTGPKLLKEDNVNDVCFSCHADKRGPFLWEHQPVVESCLNCHLPHGSTQARMLTERPPMLCQNCHAGSGHHGSPYNANNLPSAADSRGVSARILARGCVNCHSQIHGSNSPSGQTWNR